MALPENISIGKIFNRYGKNVESEQDLRDLSTQQRKRNLMVAGFIVFGGVAGFMLAKRLNLKTWAKLATTALGGAIFGTTVSMLTQDKYNRRSEAIEEKRQNLEKIRYLTEIAERGANKTDEKIKEESNTNN